MMNFKKFAATALIALTGALTALAGASAYEAAATTALNVRTGSGTNYAVIAALSPNQVVRVDRCNASNTWCEVRAANIRGWASARYLRPLPSARPSDNDRPNVGVSVQTPNFSFSFGTGDRPRRNDGEICFYEGYDYRGRSFCVEDDDGDRRLSNFWNNRIRSARFYGNVDATVCTGGNYSGRCAVIGRSVRNLGMLSDNISSYYVGRR